MYGGIESLESMWHQVRYIRTQMVDIMKTHEDGVHLLGYSQGEKITAKTSPSPGRIFDLEILNYRLHVLG